MRPSILIVDDEPAQRKLLQAVLGKEHEVVPAADGHEAVDLLRQRSFDLVITDERMPGMRGSELVRWGRERAPETPFVILTAHGSVETAVEAMKLGATDYLTKPLGSPEELRLVVAKALRERRLVERTLLHDADTEIRFPERIVAESEAMQQVLSLAESVAGEPTTVLLTGESGTGKEVVARSIHRGSDRGGGPFVAVNCAAISEQLLESEMFGHEKGAFTGASDTRRGRFELAHAGTLFLDEIGEMGPRLQAKLLRVLEEQRFERVGGNRTLSVDVRVIAATNRDPARAMEAGMLRADLYYRLSAFPIHIPPLRERREDILPLAEHFLAQLSSRMGRQPPSLSRAAIVRLQAHDWPGNARELRNAVERALIVARGEQIEVEDLPLPPAGSAPGREGIAGEPRGNEPSAAGREDETTSSAGNILGAAESAGAGVAGGTLAELERRAILAALERHEGNRREAAEELGISVRKLQYRLAEYGLTGRGDD